DWLLDGYGTDADATWLLDYHELWIVPMANPDGHWLVELGTDPGYGGVPFFQRKSGNLDANSDGIADCTAWPPETTWQYGIDLNRNHSFQWGGTGSSGQGCKTTYRGPNAASEPEVVQLQRLIQSLISDQRGPLICDAAPPDTTGIFISLHSYSELVLWPWGFDAAPVPNLAGLEAIGGKLATYNQYISCQAATCLYIADGTSDDWTYGVLGIPSFTFELGTQFMPPFEEIETNQWPRNGPAFEYAAKLARTPYMSILGPDVKYVAAVTSSNTITLTATLNEISHGLTPIMNAIYTIDIPPWADAAQPQPLQASDGIFDEAIEEVTAVIPTHLLSPGQHTLFVQGQDTDGNWGIVSATFINKTTETDIYLPFIGKRD
ncbi:MAG: hypothetical protein KAG66_07485, partial [Methylococcales bacterium]|nr:hypothetical protein [Methylococcales bacterium]